VFDATTDALCFRHVQPSDYVRVTEVLDDWWGRPMRERLSQMFFVHFTQTSYLLELDGQLVGFLLGFLSQSYPSDAYVHFVGVHPDYRFLGLGKRLYERFFAIARLHGRQRVRAMTSPNNAASIAFHLHLGFDIDEADGEVAGVGVCLNYAGPGEHRVLFARGVSALHREGCSAFLPFGATRLVHA
jgi:GNAT superfamily N-acetyltransferase